jgi:predicted MFS family arabinose efflux permease
MAGIYLVGAAGMILCGRSSDRAKEARLHCGIPALLGAVGIAGVAFSGSAPELALPMLTLWVLGTMSAIPVFWQLPNLFFSGTAAAAGIALINSFANLAGFGAPWLLGHIKTTTGHFTLGLFVIAAVEALTLVLIVAFIPERTRAP